MSHKNYSVLIKNLRQQSNLSQIDVAKRLGLSRASYIGLEKGDRELSLSEALELTKLFNISIEQLAGTPVVSDETYIDMIRYFLRLAHSDKTVIKKTRLAKLLYLSDMSYYYQYKSSLSGQYYRKLVFGPMSDNYLRIIDELEQKGTIIITQILRDDYHMYEITESRSASKQNLSTIKKKHETHLKKIWQAWSKATTADLQNFTDNHAPYQNTHAGDTIDYKHILDLAPHLVF